MNSERINYDEILRSMAASLRDSFKTLLNRAKFDKTFKAKIVSNLGNNKYQILYKGENYTVTSNMSLNIDQMVFVCAPQNNWSELFVVQTSGGGNNNNNSLPYIGDVSSLITDPNILYSFIGYITGDIITQVGLPVTSPGWYTIVYLHHPNDDGWATRLAFPYGQSNYFYKSSASGNVWNGWARYDGTLI